MKHSLLTLGLILFTMAAHTQHSSASDKAPATATATTTATMLREQALVSDLGWRLVESLTTEVGPRLAGTEGDVRAVKWAKAKLESLGFDRVWLEPVLFPLWQRQTETARVLSPFPQPLRITALGYSGSTDGEINAELLLLDDLAALQRASAAQISGKIVFINKSIIRHREGRGYGNGVGARSKGPALAQQKGAVAFLLRSVGTDSHRFPHTGAMTFSEQPLPAAALSAPDADQLQRLLGYGKPVRLALNIQTSFDAGQSWNVIAQLNGREQPAEVVLLGAHLDSWDLATGAIDDGAGVAITTAAAASIAALPVRPRRSIRLVLFANEEQGLWGAKAYAKAHQAELKQHVFASESDFGAGKVWRFDSANKTLLDAAMPVLAPLNIERGAATTSGGPDISPLAAAGVAVAKLKQDGTDYFDYHHTADDTLDKIDASELRQNIAAWAVVSYFAAELAELLPVAQEQHARAN